VLLFSGTNFAPCRCRSRPRWGVGRAGRAEREFREGT
jgi:hypothetical protein